MRPSKIVAAVLAVGIGVFVVHSLSRGTDPAVHVPTVCEDSRLPYPDQAKCSSDLKTALTDDARQSVVAQYQAKLDAMAPPVKTN